MYGNRAAATADILDNIDLIIPGSNNRKIWEETLSKMSDKEFHKFIDDLDTERRELSIVDPLFAADRAQVENNIEVMKKLGGSFFHRLVYTSAETGRKMLTPFKYFVCDVPVRRLAQMWEKKASIPKDNRAVDELTDQPTGGSKGSKLSYPELQMLGSEALDNSIVEMIHYRGGDEMGFRAMNKLLTTQGTVNLETLDRFSGKVKSVSTLRNLLLAMHLSNTL